MFKEICKNNLLVRVGIVVNVSSVWVQKVHRSVDNATSLWNRVAVGAQDEEMGNFAHFRDNESPRFGLRTLLEALQADSSLG